MIKDDYLQRRSPGGTQETSGAFPRGFRDQEAKQGRGTQTPTSASNRSRRIVGGNDAVVGCGRRLDVRRPRRKSRIELLSPRRPDQHQRTRRWVALYPQRVATSSFCRHRKGNQKEVSASPVALDQIVVGRDLSGRGENLFERLIHTRRSPVSLRLVRPDCVKYTLPNLFPSGAHLSLRPHGAARLPVSLRPHGAARLPEIVASGDSMFFKTYRYAVRPSGRFFGFTAMGAAAYGFTDALVSGHRGRTKYVRQSCTSWTARRLRPSRAKIH
jgi:hypothetical protein